MLNFVAPAKSTVLGFCGTVTYIRNVHDSPPALCSFFLRLGSRVVHHGILRQSEHFVLPPGRRLTTLPGMINWNVANAFRDPQEQQQLQRQQQQQQQQASLHQHQLLMEQEEALVEATSSLSPLRPVDDPCSIILGSPRVRAAARSTFPSMNDEIMSDQDMPPSTQDSLDSSGSSSALSCRAEAASGQSQQQQQHASSPGGDCNPPAASSSSDINTGAGTSSASWSPFQQPQPRTRRAIAVPVRLDASMHAICYRYAQGRAAAGDGRWQGRTAHLHYFLPENWSPSYKFTVFEDSYILSLAPTDEEMQQQQQQQHSGGAGANAAASPAATLSLHPHLASATANQTAARATRATAAAAYYLARPLHSASPGTSRERGTERSCFASISPATVQEMGAHVTAMMAAGGTPVPPEEFELVWPVALDQTLLEAVAAACDRVVPGAKRKPQSLSLTNAHLKLQKLAL